MKKRCLSVLLLAALTFSLCGCGNLFEKEYVVVEDYVPGASQDSSGEEKIVVKSLSSLKQAIQRMVTDGAAQGSIVFASDYSGDLTEDLASACWQVRTQNALCAYCVENISYELNRIVSHTEAEIRISYVDFGGTMEDITKLSFSSGLEELILNTLTHSGEKLAVYVTNGTYTAEGVENLVQSVYRAHPSCVPGEPRTTVNVYSGTGLQRLYEIRFKYGMTEEEMETRRGKLSALEPFAELDTQGLSQGAKALAACTYLVENCLLSESQTDNSAYSALLDGAANSEGLALAYVELCHRLGLECDIVYGLKDWNDHCWNIVTVDGENYHVDVSSCIENWIGSGFLLSDQQLWGAYRWDISSYASCSGGLSYAVVAGVPERENSTWTGEDPADAGEEEPEHPDDAE